MHSSLFQEWFHLLQTNGVTAAIFSHLTARQIPEAAKLAIENKDLRLALLLSQAGTCQDLKTLLNKQLCDWNKTMVCCYGNHWLFVVREYASSWWL